MAGTDRIDVVPFHRGQVFDKFLSGNIPSGPGAEFMTVHALEDNSFSIQSHDGILHLETAEANSLRNHFRDLSFCIHNLDKQVVKMGFLCAPEQRIFHLHHISFSALQRILKSCLLFSFSGKSETNLSGSCGFQLHGEICLRKGIVQKRTDRQILHMDLRNRIEINVTVDTGEPEEILILTPASAGPFEDLGRQLVLSLFQIRSQFKLGRGEAVLAVTHEFSVEPEGQAALRSLEGDEDFLSLHGRRYFKIFYIACHRIELLWNLAGFYLFSALPGVLDVGILRFIIAFHLDMGRHANVAPGFTAVVFLLKTRNRTPVIFRIMEFPEAVQTVTELLFFLLHRRQRSEITVIGMGSYPILAEISRVFYFFVVKFTHLL